MTVTRFRKSLLLLYVLLIFLGPRLSSHIRGEDILFPLMLIATFYALPKRILEISSLFIIYFAYGLLITSFAIVSHILPVTALLIWGKELQYFVGFLLFLVCIRRDKAVLRLFEKTLVAIAIAIAIYYCYKLLSGTIRHYGITYFTEPDSPSLSAWLYFNLFVFLLYFRRWSSLNRILLTILSGFLLIAALGTGTRTIMVAVAVYIIVYGFYNFRLKAKFTMLLMLSCLMFLFWFYQSSLYSFHYARMPMISAPISRASTLFEAGTLTGARIGSWKNCIANAYEKKTLGFGGGRGFTHLRDDGAPMSLGMGADNQYTVNLAELGLAGSIIFFGSLLFICQFIHPDLKRLYYPYLISCVVSGFALEVFQLSKSGQLFWLNTAYIIGLSTLLHKADINSNNAFAEAAA